MKSLGVLMIAVLLSVACYNHFAQPELKMCSKCGQKWMDNRDHDCGGVVRYFSVPSRDVRILTELYK